MREQMYQALYRKYRPQTFSDVYGQPHVTVTLKNELKQGRISHAYLFTGSRGTGKTSCAKILAKGVNCLDLQDGDPCGVCENCREIDAGNLDVLEIDAASNNGVENIRDLREKIHFLPAKMRYRVYIIDEVHMLSAGAFNALLKTLEEPPPHGIFILATTEVHKLPTTILSRCQRFDFGRIAVKDIADRLLQVSRAEGIQLEQSAAQMIARIADGGMRDALSLLDLCSGAAVVDEKAVAKAAGLADKGYLEQLAESIRRKDSAAVLETIDALYASSCDMERLCEELIGYYRDMMVIKAVGGAGNALSYPHEEYEKRREQAETYTLPQIIGILSTLGECLNELRRSTMRRVVLEMRLLTLCSPQLQSTPEALLSRVAALEKTVEAWQTSGVQNAVSGRAAETPKPGKAEPKPQVVAAEPQKKIPPEDMPVRDETAQEIAAPPIRAEVEKPAATEENGMPLRCWPDILDRLKARNRLIHAVLQGSDAYIRGDLLLIDAKTEQFQEFIKGDSRHREDIRAAAMAVTGKQYRLGPYTRGAKKTVKQADPMDLLAQKIKQHGFTVENE